MCLFFGVIASGPGKSGGRNSNNKAAQSDSTSAANRIPQTNNRSTAPDRSTAAISTCLRSVNLGLQELQLHLEHPQELLEALVRRFGLGHGQGGTGRLE